jgi:hypothetical protein
VIINNPITINSSLTVPIFMQGAKSVSSAWQKECCLCKREISLWTKIWKLNSSTLYVVIEHVKKNIKLFQAFMKCYSVPNSKCQANGNFGQSQTGIISALDLYGKSWRYTLINQWHSQILLTAGMHTTANSCEGEVHSTVFTTWESVQLLDDLQCGYFW